MDSSAYKIVNPSFDFEFNGKTYLIKKASLEKVIQYQKKAQELISSKDPASDQKIIAHCIYLVLKDHDPEITEEFILNNTPGDVEVMDCLTTLGFMNPSKVAIAKETQNLILKQLTSEKSSSI